MTVSPRSVFVIHPGALGDVLLSRQALEALRKQYPTHHLAILARSDIGRVLRRCGVVDQALPLDSDVLASFFAGAAYVNPPVQRVLRSCDHLVAWLDDVDHGLRNTFASVGIQRITLKAAKPRAGLHQSLSFLSTVTDDLPDKAHVRPLEVGEDFREEGSAACRRMGVHGRRFILCHPGSGSPHKCADARLWVRLIQSLLDWRHTVILVEGPADAALIERVKACGCPDLPIIANEPLETIAGLIAGADLFVGHDSGLTHLAAAIGVPVVALFGPTDPAQWAPLGRHVAVVTGRSCLCPTRQAVQACLNKPCFDIPAGAVAQACSSFLTRYHPVTKS
jgi:ADP-heptose:LPS heptosyltransferase